MRIRNLKDGCRSVNNVVFGACRYCRLVMSMDVPVNHPLLNSQIVYTGITRAKKRAVVVGGENVLSAALGRKLVRNTGLPI